MERGRRGATVFAATGAEAVSRAVVLDVRRSFQAPEGFLQVPRLQTGSEAFDIVVPDGLQLALVDLALTDAPPLTSADITQQPARGAVGLQQVTVRWSYPVPFGRVAFRLRVHATADGTPPPVTVILTEPASERRMRALIAQDCPVDLGVEGALVQVFHDQILSRGGSIAALARPMDGGIISGPTAVVVISLAVIAAICVLVGFAAFAAVVIIAINKGYNVDNAGYKVAVGEGTSRQEHQMLFNLRKP